MNIVTGIDHGGKRHYWNVRTSTWDDARTTTVGDDHRAMHKEAERAAKQAEFMGRLHLANSTMLVEHEEHESA